MGSRGASRTGLAAALAGLSAIGAGACTADAPSVGSASAELEVGPELEVEPPVSALAWGFQSGWNPVRDGDHYLVAWIDRSAPAGRFRPPRRHPRGSSPCSPRASRMTGAFWTPAASRCSRSRSTSSGSPTSPATARASACSCTASRVTARSSASAWPETRSSTRSPWWCRPPRRDWWPARSPRWSRGTVKSSGSSSRMAASTSPRGSA